MFTSTIILFFLYTHIGANDSHYDKFANDLLRKIMEAETIYKEEEGLASKDYYNEQIVRDLATFKKDGISRKSVDESAQYGVRYQIVGHKLYRQDNCMFPTRCEGVEHFLKQIVSQLEDTEFILNPQDVPRAFKGMNKMVVFSFSKDDNVFDILYPAWAFWSGGPSISKYPQGIGHWDQTKRDILNTADRIDWNSKTSKGFFLGSRTNSIRDPLVLLSRKRPDLVDAQYTKNQAYKGPQDTLGVEPAAERAFEENCYYKYLFNFRGVAASFRFKHLLLCNSVVFHLENGMTEFFYHKMIPYIHYIPIENNTEEGLEKLINFFMEHDEIAKRIAKRSQQWARLKLTNRDVKNYWINLLQNYTQLLNFNIIRNETLKAI